MATLTWRDVVGGVRAPDLSEATAAITRGIEGLGESVSALANGPAQRRNVQLANQLSLISTEQKFLDSNRELMEEQTKKADADAEKAALKSFSRVQSQLESGVRDAARKGLSVDDFLAKSELFGNLDENARSFAASHLSDAAYQGLTLREKDEDDAVRNQQWNASFGLQREASSRAARESNLRIKAMEKEMAAADKNGKLPWKTEDKETNEAAKEFTRRVGLAMMGASGGVYDEKSIADVAKESGIGDFSDAASTFRAFNLTRQKQGLPVLPDNSLKALLAQGSNKSWWLDSFDEDLSTIADQYDRALEAQGTLQNVYDTINRGGTYEVPGMQAEFDRLLQKQPVGVPIPDGALTDRGRRSL